MLKWGWPSTIFQGIINSLKQAATKKWNKWRVKTQDSQLDMILIKMEITKARVIGFHPGIKII